MLPLANTGILTFSLWQKRERNNIYETIVVVQGSLNKFPDFFRMGTFIDSTHMKLGTRVSCVYYQ